MALIDKGTHMQDEETGANYAKSESFDKKKKPLSKKYRSPLFWDTVFGLYVEYRDGKLTMPAICKQMKVPMPSVRTYAHRNGWNEKAATIIRKRSGASEKTLTTSPAEMVASSLASDQTEFRENASELLTRASRDLKRMTPKAYMKKTKEVKEMVDTMKVVNPWNGDEEKAVGNTPVLNIAVLLGDGVKMAVATEIAT